MKSRGQKVNSSWPTAVGSAMPNSVIPPVRWCCGSTAHSVRGANSSRRVGVPPRQLGLRVIVIERPGTGLSDSHRYTSVSEWVADMAQVADALDAEQLGVVGMSGGGPYALACGALPPLVDRVAAVGVLDGTVPAVGPEATRAGATNIARRFGPILTQLRRPLAVIATILLAPLIPFAHYAYRLYMRMWPEIDRRVLDDPEVEAIFVDDMVNAFRGRCLAMVDDARLLGRDWGFRLVDVKVPVRWWHGETDHVVPIARRAHGHHTPARRRTHRAPREPPGRLRHDRRSARSHEREALGRARSLRPPGVAQQLTRLVWSPRGVARSCVTSLTRAAKIDRACPYP